jgi:hypothetical protein
MCCTKIGQYMIKYNLYDMNCKILIYTDVNLKIYDRIDRETVCKI